MLEVCVDSVESAVAAKEGGAERLELCAALVIGGISPTPALYEAVKKRVDTPVRAMVRPRFGDFLYTPAEKEVMLAETRAWKDAGVEGVVTGALLADGTLARLDAHPEKLAFRARGRTVPRRVHGGVARNEAHAAPRVRFVRGPVCGA